MKAPPDELAQSLAAFLETLPGHKQFLIAYSGGLDSHVLLHLMACLGREAGYSVSGQYM